MPNFNTKLQKISGEIRFKPTLASYKNAFEFAKFLESKFEHWRIDNRTDLTLFDSKKKMLMRVKFNAVLFSIEGEESDIEQMLMDQLSIVEAMKKDGAIKEFKHIGCRRQIIVETDFEKQDLIDLTFKKFYGNLEIIKNASGDKPIDTVFILDSQKDKYGNHVHIGPAEKKQALELFASAFQKSADELSTEKQYLFFDVDIYKRDGLTMDNFNFIQKDTIEKTKTMLDSYLEFVTK